MQAPMTLTPNHFRMPDTEKKGPFLILSTEHMILLEHLGKETQLLPLYVRQGANYLPFST